MPSPTNKNTGRVCLVGAGPGDPGLITVLGRDRLAAADVVVYDALSNPALLDGAPPEAERLYVGKRATCHSLSQDQINQLLVDHARRGRRVVRLKGGDPYLFGRGAEEVAHVAGCGIDCEVVPGVSAGLAVPATAGIPVTHRKLASTVTLVTGHEDPTKDRSAIDYASLAGLIRAGGTVCFYMGVGRIGSIAEVLMQEGLAPQTPVAVIQWGTTPRQRCIRAGLAEAPAVVAEAAIGSPAIILVGVVAGIDEPGLDYFTRRPLFGRRIVITRTRQQASDLRRLLEDLGAVCLEAPTIRIAPDPEGQAELDRVIPHLDRFDWLVLTSANGAEVLADRLNAQGLDARHLGRDKGRGGNGPIRVAAIGPATATALHQKLGIRADLVPPRFVAESLAEELIHRHAIPGQRLLLLRADIARPILHTMLADAGAQVTELSVYQTQRVDTLPQDVLDALIDRQVDWVTFTSSSTARNMVELLGEHRDALEHVKIASIGPITSRTLRDLGLPPHVEAERSDITGLVETIVDAQAGHHPPPA